MENEKKVKICRLCLQSCNNNFSIVDDTKKYMLEILRLKLEESISGDEIICENCRDDLKKCFDFKVLCQYTEECIRSFSSKDTCELDLTEIYLKENGVETKSNLPEGCVICRLCLKLIYNNCVYLCGKSKDVTLEILLRQYFPELDLRKIKDPAICSSCESSLQSYFGFVRKFIDKDVVLDLYKVDDTESQGTLNQVELKCEIDNDNFNMPKKIKLEKTDIKMEDTNFDRIQDSTIPSVEESFVHSLAHSVKTENNLEDKTENLEFQFEDHLLIHQNVPESSFYHCDVCSFKTKHKGCLRRHVLMHQNGVPLFKCELCDFQTKVKGALKPHMLVHRDSSEVTMYHCQVCLFQTKRKSNLKAHLLVHQDRSEATLYQCPNCDFETKHRGSLTQHAVVHHNTLEAKRYQCDVCGFNTKRKNALTKHSLVHQPDSETYNCHLCKYKTKYEKNLKRHVIIHREAPKVTVRKYPCDLCSYKGVNKYHLTRHMLIHKDMSEVTTYQCSVCEHKTKYKLNFNKHMLLHKDPSEVTMYRCGLCWYETKRKDNLKPHMVRKHNLEKDQFTLTVTDSV